MDQRLNIVVEAVGTQQAADKVEGVATATEHVGKQTEETNKKTAKLRQTLSTLATGFAAYKAYSWVKGAVGTTTELARATMTLSNVTGMDSKEAGAWVKLAHERDVSAKSMTYGFVTLARSISSAANGSKAAQAAFSQLGLDASNLKVQDAHTQLSMLADSFAALPNGVDKAALAQKLFGRNARMMIPLLDKGSKALNAQVDETAKYSGITNKTVKDGMDMVRQQRELSASMLGVKVAVGTALIPLLTTLAEALAPLARGFAALMQHSGAFRIAVVALTAALVTWIAVARIATLTGIELEASTAPIIAIIAGIVIGLVLLYKKCAWFRAAVQAVFHAVVAAFEWIKNAAIDVFGWIKDHWKLLLSILGGPIGAVAVQIISHFDDIKGAIVGVWNFLKKIGGYIGGAFADAWGVLKSALGPVIDVLKTVFGVLSDIANVVSKVGGFISGVIGGGPMTVGQKAAVHAQQVHPVPIRQHGGYMSMGGMALVGEKGPEMVHLPQGAHVHPFVQGYGSGHEQHVHHIYLDGHRIMTALGDRVATAQAAR